MFKNVASQKVALFAFDTTTGAAKTGDSANITPYVSKDYGAVTVLGTASATEMDATNAKGWYSFTLAQAETNADALLFTGKSSTANISVVGQLIYTTPPNFSAFSLNSSGQVDVIKLNGTPQTARDVGASVLLSPGTGTGQVNLSSGRVPVTSNVLKAAAISNFMFVLTDSTTHAPKTSAASIVVQISKDGGAFASSTNSAVEIANGAYYVALTSSETNCNAMIVRVTATSCDDQLIPVFTQP